MESRAGVAWADATIGDGEGGGLMGSERQQGGMARGGGNGRAETACSLLGPKLQVESRADGSRSAAETQQLCGSAGTDQPRGDGKKAKTKKASKGVGSRGAGAVKAVGSRADVG